MKILLKFLAIFLTFNLSAQFYNTGQDPASIRWKQINTEHFRIVYPSFADSIARVVASTLDWSYQNVTSDMNHKPRKVGVVIHGETSISNGMVTWAPRRVELFSVPPADNYAHDWFEQLAIHEYRHVIQIDKLNQGLTKFLYYLFGEQAVGGVLGAYIPIWFLEGDAVWSETEYSLTGRGRMWSFSEPLMIQFQQLGAFSFDKATMGSYKHFVPNEYVIGYNFLNEIHRHYGDSVVPNVLSYVGRNPYMIIPFSRSLMLNTGYRKRQLFDNMMDSLQTRWKDQLNYNPELLSWQPITEKKEDYNNYRFPFEINDSIVLYLKTSYNHLPKFVYVNKNKKLSEEKTLFSVGYSPFYNVSLENGILCWEELRFDARWQHRQSNVIMLYDLKKKKKVQLTKNSRYFSPELNPDASKVAVIEITPVNRYDLVIIDIATKDKVSFQLPYMISTIQWCSKYSRLYFVGHTTKGQNIAYLDLTNGQVVEVLKPDYFQKGLVHFEGDTIYFNAEYEGPSGVYGLVCEGNSVFKIETGRYSANDAYISHSGHLYFTIPTAYGYRPVAIYKSELEINPFSIKSHYNDSLVLAKETRANIQRDGFVLKKYESKKYSKMGHLFTFHSWGLTGMKGSNYDLMPGFHIMSQNLLGTSEFVISHNIRRSLKLNSISAEYIYKGWYPQLSLKYEYFNEQFENKFGPEDSLYAHYISGRISQPLVLNRRRWISNLNLFLESQIVSYKFVYGGSSQFHHSYPDVIVGVYFDLYKRMTYRQLYPSLGFQFWFSNYGSIIKQGSIYIGQANVFLPGILRNHSLRLYAGYQEVRRYHKKLILLNYEIRTPRAYTGFWDNRIFATSVDYSFPIAYPDWSLGSVFYFKRLKMNLFYDWAYKQERHQLPFDYAENFGGDLIFEGHVFRSVTPIEYGIRYAKDRDNNSFYQFIFGMGLP